MEKYDLGKKSFENSRRLAMSDYQDSDVGKKLTS